MTPIISSLLDLDFYKLTVGEFIFKNFRGQKAQYNYVVRNAEKIRFWDYVHVGVFAEHLEELKGLSLTPKEAEYLLGLGFDKDYVAFLSNKPLKDVSIWFFSRTETFCVGAWESVMLFETLTCCIGNELFSEGYCADEGINPNWLLASAEERFDKKLDYLAENNLHKGEANLVEFGTRRRVNKAFQFEAIDRLNDGKYISGTSNVYAAMHLGITPVGTQGHELYMGLQGIFALPIAQTKAVELWSVYWDGKYDIFLDDTLGSKAFYRDTRENNLIKAKGFRHDSGDEIKWMHNNFRCLSKYMESEMIFKKKVMFTNGLDFQKMFDIRGQVARYGYKDIWFGIGTYISNDTFIPVPQAVMKISMMNGFAVLKSSNDIGKTQCADANILKYATENLISTI